VSVLSKRLIPSFFGIATIGWVIGGTMWYKHQFLKAESRSATTALISVSKRTAEEGQMFLCFPNGEAKALFTIDNLKTLQLTANFLNDNYDKSLIINGLQGQNEIITPTVNPPNLGLLRAESVKNVLIQQGAPTSALTATGKIVPHLTIEDGYLFDAVKFELVENSQAQFKSLNLLYREKGFQFAENKILTDYFSALWHYLEQNPKARVTIAAFHSNTEGGKIATKRLQFLQQYLKGHDFNFKQIQFNTGDDKKPMKSNDNDSKKINLPDSRVEIRIQIA
jgi:hypothetical protein